MEDNWNLSEKMVNIVDSDDILRLENVFKEKDVKEFIKILKEVVLIYGRRALPRIDKLVGKELTNGN